MHPAAHQLIAQSRIDDFHRAAASSARRAEARDATAVRTNRRPAQDIVLRPSMFRRLAARLAL
jgi:hypothetical protein